MKKEINVCNKCGEEIIFKGKFDEKTHFFAGKVTYKSLFQCPKCGNVEVIKDGYSYAHLDGSF